MAKAKAHPSYDVSDNTYDLKRSKTLPKSGWKTEIGDRGDTNKFRPHFRLSRWADEASFGIDFPAAFVGPDDSLSHDGEALVWSRGGITARFFDLPFDPEDQEGAGSFEWEIELASVPATNLITLPLSRTNVRFSYQPALTVQEIADGYERPDRVVGSYAVYSTLGKTGGDYQVGKVAHLYRPLVRDALGDTIWGEYNIDAEATGLLTITVDAAWLAAAVYPITIDPTIGYTTAGASALPMPTTSCRGHLNDTYVAVAGDEVTQFHFHGKRVGGADQNFDIAAYSVTSAKPDSRLAVAETVIVNSTTAQWWDSAVVSQALSGGTTYTVCEGNNSASNLRMSYDTLSASMSRDDVTALPATWGEDGTNNEHLSFYADVVAGFQEITFDADLIIVDRLTKTFDADIIIIDRLTVTFDADIIVVARLIITFDADIIVFRPTITFDTDLIVVDRLLQTFDADLLTVDRLLQTFDADLLTVDRLLQTFDADLIVFQPTITFDVDLIIVARLTITFDADIIVVGAVEITFDVDIIIFQPTITFDIDLIVVDRLLQTFDADLLTVDRLLQTFDADIFLLDRLTIIFDADILVGALTVDFDADIIVVDRLLQTFDADTIVVDRLTITFDVDILIVNRQLITFNADISLVDRLVQTFDTDVVIRDPYILTPISNGATQQLTVVGAPTHVEAVQELPVEIDISDLVELATISSVGLFGQLEQFIAENVPGPQRRGTIVRVDIFNHVDKNGIAGIGNQCFFIARIRAAGLHTGPTHDLLDPDIFGGKVTKTSPFSLKDLNDPNSQFTWTDVTDMTIEILASVLSIDDASLVRQRHFTMWAQVFRFQDTEPVQYPDPTIGVYAIAFTVDIVVFSRILITFDADLTVVDRLSVTFDVDIIVTTVVPTGPVFVPVVVLTETDFEVILVNPGFVVTLIEDLAVILIEATDVEVSG